MNMAGIPHGKVNATKTLKMTLRSWFETSQLAVTKTSATWYRKMP
jgi:hypothetical protein